MASWDGRYNNPNPPLSWRVAPLLAAALLMAVLTLLPLVGLGMVGQRVEEKQCLQWQTQLKGKSASYLGLADWKIEQCRHITGIDLSAMR